jgi:elongation factor 3
MKLAMARAMLQKADILLLDEPTNHLDVINVAWVKNYINSLKNVTCIMVSHDSGFLRDCCTHILQIQRLKLRQFRGNLDSFIEANPEAKSYFNIKSSKLRFKYVIIRFNDIGFPLQGQLKVLNLAQRLS